MKVFLVRHGQASAGTDNYDRLSTLGIKQAKLLGEFWKQAEFSIDYAFSGSLQRQQHTAEHALSELQNTPAVKTIEALNEYDHIVVDALFSDAGAASDGLDLSFDQYLTMMSKWEQATAAELKKRSGAISFDAFSNQGWSTVQNEVKRVANTDENASTCVFFTSGGVIATILQKLLKLEFKPTMDMIWQTQNTSIAELNFDLIDGNIVNTCLVSYNTVPHLQLHHDKTLITQI